MHPWITRATLPVLAAATLAVPTAATAAAAAPANKAVPPTPGSLTPHTVSGTYATGVSAGGAMANQLHVAHSGTIKGAGIFTAPAYGCSQGNVSTALNACMKTYLPRQTPAQLEQLTRNRADQGKVDPVANLSGDPVYLYHGTNDTTIAAAVNDDLATYYRDLGAGVLYDNTSAAGHAWVSPQGPGACSVTASPYINDCGTDPEGAMLGHLFGGVRAPNTAGLTGTLIRFDQQAYTGGDPAGISMGKDGFAYVPQSCASGTACKLVVSLHGCLQSYGSVQTSFVDKAYLNEYADTNDTIVLYPQAAPSALAGNPNGCFNWWGYQSDTAYDTKGGKQIETIMRMVHALGG